VEKHREKRLNKDIWEVSRKNDKRQTRRRGKESRERERRAEKPSTKKLLGRGGKRKGLKSKGGVKCAVRAQIKSCALLRQGQLTGKRIPNSIMP
jgi:hypothetical protein